MMNSYKLMQDGSVMRDADLALIPPTKDNADWRQYLADVKAGAIVEPFDYAAEAARQADASKNLRRAEISAQRDAKLAEGALWNGRRWQMDDVMRSALQWRITRWQLGRLAADATLPVRAMDNTIHLLGRDDHLALAEAIEAAGGAIYAESWMAKDAL